MALEPLKLPESLSELNKGDHDLKRIEELLNALQRLQVRVTKDGATQVATGYIQISGSSAVIEINL